MKYAILTEVQGHWMADILESYLRSEEIDVVLVQDAVSHITHITTFAPVQIFVPKAGIKRARELLKVFNNTQNDTKEKIGMANKKKIEERNKAIQSKQTERTIQRVGIAVIIVIVLALGYLFVSNRGEPVVATEAPQLADVPQSTEAPAVAEPSQSTSKQYDAYPPMTIDEGKKYFATVKMANGGEFVMQLFPDKALLTVNSFVFLARDGYFDGVTFHRVLEGFMAQGGDPTGTGSGGPGYEFANEDSDLTFNKDGVVAMANAGRDTNGSQFFITFGAQEFLNGGYTIFGQVIEGMDVVNAITRRDPEQFPDYQGDAIETITITEE